ncbi:MAG: glycosyltransferase [Gemmatimonadetes bacterium]|nr:glycosyltransferase [Gemmatimonadota bacterium]
MGHTHSSNRPERPRNVIGVSLEDYYHAGAFQPLVEPGHWTRFESRLSHATGAALALLDEVGAQATFFTLGWVAEHMPELVRSVIARGHDVANAGFSHAGVRQLDRRGLEGELRRGHAAIAAATGRAPRGVRIPDFVRSRDRWAFDVVAELGYDYDASFRPLGRESLPAPLSRYPFTWQHGTHALRVFPVPTMSLGGWLLPVGGGAWLRQLPAPLVRHALASWPASPLALYFQAWELDLEQPRLTAVSRLSRRRHYGHLERAAYRLREAMRNKSFTSYERFLDLAPIPVAAVVRTATVQPVVLTPAPRPRHPVTVVVPCFNEEESLPFLFNTLASVRRDLASEYEVSFLFVNDGSRDATGALLEHLAHTLPGSRVVHHQGNRGIAHAIRTGIEASRDELTCSIDADCTYDPHQLSLLLPALRRGAAMVTASPYHPAGRVRHVPEWRLVLSRTLSRMYTRALGTGLHTYTSCFRAYRRSAMIGLPQSHGGFLGIAEMLVRTVLAGERVEEVPATLEVRLIGHSKLKILRVIRGHLGLLRQLRRWPDRRRDVGTSPFSSATVPR